MNATVYTTAGGRRFHADPRCRALVDGQALSDWEGVPSAYRPVMHRREPRQPLAAALTGYTACRVCVPPALALPSTGQTHGHEPFGPYDGALICRRCYLSVTREWIDAPDAPRHQRVRYAVPWPCTSAVVLGLAPRCRDCGDPADAPGGQKCRSCEHDDQLDAWGAAL